MSSKKNTQPIVFIGFMGSGKSTCARSLAKLLDWRDLDSDVIIERREKKAIPQIFKTKGESYFRTIESKVIKDLLQKPQSVLAFGGGVVCRKVNRVLIRKRAFVVWLKVSSDVLALRTRKSKNRPLLNVRNRKEAIVSLLKERDLYYKRCANVIIPNNSGDVLEKIKRIPRIKELLREKRS